MHNHIRAAMVSERAQPEQRVFQPARNPTVIGREDKPFGLASRARRTEIAVGVRDVLSSVQHGGCYLARSNAAEQALGS